MSSDGFSRVLPWMGPAPCPAPRPAVGILWWPDVPHHLPCGRRIRITDAGGFLIPEERGLLDTPARGPAWTLCLPRGLGEATQPL